MYNNQGRSVQWLDIDKKLSYHLKLLLFLEDYVGQTSNAHYYVGQLEGVHSKMKAVR